MNITTKRLLAFALIVLGVMSASTAQLTDLFGPTAAKTIISGASLLSSVLATWVAANTNEANTVTNAQGVQGVQVQVDKTASSAVAKLAMDPAMDNVTAKPQDAAQVAKNARDGLS